MIFLECDNDEAVVRGLGFPRGAVEHHSSKGRVAKFLQRATGGKHFGLVDQDPGANPPAYFREFYLVEEHPDFRLKRYRHRRDAKELIEVQPDLEPWLYAAAASMELKPADFHLPACHKRLHDNPRAYARRLTEMVKFMEVNLSAHLALLKGWLRAQ